MCAVNSGQYLGPVESTGNACQHRRHSAALCRHLPDAPVLAVHPVCLILQGQLHTHPHQSIYLIFDTGQGMTKYDSRYKITFSNDWLVQQFVRAFLHKSVTDIIDFDSFEIFSTESISKDPKYKRFKVRHNDVMWKIGLSDGSRAYVLLMVEAQSNIDSAMAVRVGEYVLNWYRYLMVAEGLEVLPLIVPMVVYNGEKAWNAATRLHDMIHTPAAFRDLGIAMDGGYILVDEKRLYESGGLPSDNIFGPLIKALHTRADDEFAHGYDMTTQMLEQSGVNQDFIKHIKSFILDLKKIDDSKVLLAKLIQQQRGKRDMTATIADFEQQIRQRVRQEGMREKAREFARLMLGDGKPEQEIRRYTDLSSEEIRQIKSELQESGD